MVILKAGGDSDEIRTKWGNQNAEHVYRTDLSWAQHMRVID